MKLLVISNDTKLSRLVEESAGRDNRIEASLCQEAGNIEARIAEVRPEAVLMDTAFFPEFSEEVVKGIKKLEPFLPVISVTGTGDGFAKLHSLRGGAYSAVEKPLINGEEICCIISNAVDTYRERRGMVEEMADIRGKCAADRLNLLELELVKGLQHMIGETEEPVSILKHAFSLIKNYLVFDVFAALVLRHGEQEIYVYPNAPVREDIAEAIPGTLIKKMAKLAEDGSAGVRVIIQKKATKGGRPSEDLRSAIVPLVTSDKTYGYAGLYRSEPFDYQEESVFKRFCAHIGTALEKISLFEEVKSLSTNDGLTGLYNHLFIVSRLEQEVQRSHRYGSPLSVLIFDIDDFKEVNDTFGHLAGDAVLVRIGQLLRNGVRGIDSVGRYGGEEFLVVLPETDGPTATLIGDRLKEDVGKHVFSHDNRTIHVSVSGGVASFREDRDANKLIGIADENLYRAKKEGKNMVCYDELRG